MEILSEDPTYLVGGLGILAVVFLVALRVTQQGKYLGWALAAAALALLAIGIDWVWVTDNERIASVVEDLRRAVKDSNADGVIEHLAPDVRYAPASGVRFLRYADLAAGAATRALVRSVLSDARFDLVRLTHLQVSSGAQSRRGTAEFRIFVNGTYRGMHGTSVSDWSLGLRETEPKVWKIDRITPVRFPNADELMVPAPEPPQGRGGRPRFPAGLSGASS